MANREDIIHEKLKKRIYNLIKRFEKEHSVFVEEIGYEGELNGSIGYEKIEISSSILFFGVSSLVVHEKIDKTI